MGPLELVGLPAHLVDVMLGVAFGFTLESTGFADARRLAAQFYFRELRVVQTMFTAIITAMFLTYISAALGLLDLEQVWINPTFAPSVALGGFLLGIGFVIGGYCPGTSLTALATGKVDGALFVLGSMLGMWAFGETADRFREFFYAGHYGHYQLPELLGVSLETAVLLVALLALAFFAGLKLIARLLGHERPVRWRPALAGTTIILAAAGIVIVLGQPTLDTKWRRVAARHQPRIDKREIFIEPAELVNLRADHELNLLVIDVRPESDWNQFRLAYSERLRPEQLAAHRRRLASLSDPSVIVLVSNGEPAAVKAWRYLTLLGIPNVYVLDGGINRWLETYLDSALHPPRAEPLLPPGLIAGERDLVNLVQAPLAPAMATGSASLRPVRIAGPADTLQWRFTAALGERHPASWIDPAHAPKLSYTPKVKLQRKGKRSGGCG